MDHVPKKMEDWLQVIVVEAVDTSRLFGYLNPRVT